MSRQAKLDRELGAIGFVYDRKNTKGISFYIHEDTGAEIKFPSGNLSDNQVKDVYKSARQRIGLATKDNKRDPEQIRRRNAQEREQLVRDVAKAEARLAQLRQVCDETAMAQAVQLIEDYERRMRYLDRLMRAVPA